jgi:NADH-quinone oxidoreductase subunit A
MSINVIDYVSLFIFVVISLLIVVLLFVLSYLFSIKNATAEKLSAYECGFSPFSDARQSFDVSFYVVGILLIIFDLELVLIWPWAENINFVSIFGYLVVLFFIFILIIGFVFEWKQGALNWHLVMSSST